MYKAKKHIFHILGNKINNRKRHDKYNERV